LKIAKAINWGTGPDRICKELNGPCFGTVRRNESQTFRGHSSMVSQTRVVAVLLFGSGFCALIYQTTWLREFRLIFGASTAASAAVLGVFMAGLGLGGIILGRRSEAKARPLVFYAGLEALIAASVALSPLLCLERQRAPEASCARDCNAPRRASSGRLHRTCG
jgi:hypothetical protein